MSRFTKMYMSKTNKNKNAKASILITGSLLCQDLLLKEKQKESESKLNFLSSFGEIKPVLNNFDITIGGIRSKDNYPSEYYYAIKKSGFDILAIADGKNTKENRNYILEKYENLDKHSILHAEKNSS